MSAQSLRLGTNLSGPGKLVLSRPGGSDHLDLLFVEPEVTPTRRVRAGLHFCRADVDVKCHFSHPTRGCIPRALVTWTCSWLSLKRSRLASISRCTSCLVGGGVRIHPENAHVSGRHGAQHAAQCVACAALTPSVRQ